MLKQASNLSDLRTAEFLSSLEEPDLIGQLPAFIHPIPTKIGRDEVRFLDAKGALTLPNPSFQNALLKAYVEFVHPYMPILELNDFLDTIYSADGVFGQVSLLLYQSVMFVASTYVDDKYLKQAGYPNRRTARKTFFHRVRVSSSSAYRKLPLRCAC
jgi:hypothetical protein